MSHEDEGLERLGAGVVRYEDIGSDWLPKYTPGSTTFKVGDALNQLGRLLGLTVRGLLPVYLLSLGLGVVGLVVSEALAVVVDPGLMGLFGLSSLEDLLDYTSLWDQTVPSVVEVGVGLGVQFVFGLGSLVVSALAVYLAALGMAGRPVSLRTAGSALRVRWQALVGALVCWEAVSLLMPYRLISGQLGGFIGGPPVILVGLFVLMFGMAIVSTYWMLWTYVFLPCVLLHPTGALESFRVSYRLTQGSLLTIIFFQVVLGLGLGLGSAWVVLQASVVGGIPLGVVAGLVIYPIQPIVMAYGYVTVYVFLRFVKSLPPKTPPIAAVG
jgi:hypothetical protein